MNPLAVLLASLTGNAVGASAHVSAAPTGGGAGLFAHLLTDAGQQMGAGPGAAPHPADVSSGPSSAAEAGGAGDMAEPGAAAQAIYIISVFDKEGLAVFDLSEGESDDLLPALGEGGPPSFEGDALDLTADQACVGLRHHKFKDLVGTWRGQGYR